MLLTSVNFFYVQIYKPIKAFRKGPPHSLTELAIMFDKANIDGQSSVMPGVDDAKVAQTQTQEDVHDLYKEENDTTAPSPQYTQAQNNQIEASNKCNSL